MRILIFIPARAGSKRLKNKNLRKVGGKALWEIAVDTASSFACDLARKEKHTVMTVISTDIPAILQQGRHIYQPFMELKNRGVAIHERPKNLSGDKASIYDAVDHCVKTMCNKKRRPDVVIILQPTSPLRTVDHVMEAWKLFDKANMESYKNLRSINQYGDPNGAIYILRYPIKGVYSAANTVFYEMSSMCSVDINTLADLKMARLYWKERNKER